MPNPYFKFKQFTVFHDKCAMKVGTDGVLIGAWASIDKASNILDIGTGSGLVALMLAQRAEQARIDSIEIDAKATEQANQNFKDSPFSNISKCQNVSLQDFTSSQNKKYDLIVSNPPFFLRSLKSPDAQRSLARHTDSLPIEELIELSAQLLNPKGHICFIFPASDKEHLLKLASINKLWISRITNLYPTPNSDAKRILFEFSKENSVTCESDLIVEKSRHIYSDDFINLLKDFYLKF